jgi:hypothetical protein
MCNFATGWNDLTGNGTADVLIQNVKTGELRAWEFFSGRGTPTVAGTINLDYVTREKAGDPCRHEHCQRR